MCKTQTSYKEDIFQNEGGETLAQVVQRRGGCPVPETAPGQVEWGSQQPELFIVLKDLCVNKNLYFDDECLHQPLVTAQGLV